MLVLQVYLVCTIGLSSFKRAQLIPLATAQALAAASNNHSRPCFSRTLPKHCDVKEYIEAFLFMD